MIINPQNCVGGWDAIYYRTHTVLYKIHIGLFQFVRMTYITFKRTKRVDEVDILRKELEVEKLSYSSYTPSCVHALMAIPKQDGSVRPITHCSGPKNLSVNNSMKLVFSSFSYVTLDEVVADVTQGCWMCTVDIKAAPVLVSDGERVFG